MNDDAIKVVGEIIGREIAARQYVCYACAIMADHVHLLLRRHGDRAEEISSHLQELTRSGLIDAGLRSPTHPVWTKGPG